MPSEIFRRITDIASVVTLVNSVYMFLLFSRRFEFHLWLSNISEILSVFHFFFVKTQLAIACKVLIRNTINSSMMFFDDCMFIKILKAISYKLTILTLNFLPFWITFLWIVMLPFKFSLLWIVNFLWYSFLSIVMLPFWFSFLSIVI